MCCRENGIVIFSFKGNFRRKKAKNEPNGQTNFLGPTNLRWGHKKAKWPSKFFRPTNLKRSQILCHSSPSDRARELVETSKEAESLVMSNKRTLGIWFGILWLAFFEKLLKRHISTFLKLPYSKNVVGIAIRITCSVVGLAVERSSP